MTKETCVGEMVILHLDHAEVESREWQRHDFHFDNVIDAFLSLFTFSTGAGWPDGMWASIESTQELVHTFNLYYYARTKLRRDFKLIHWIRSVTGWLTDWRSRTRYLIGRERHLGSISLKTVLSYRTFTNKLPNIILVI